MKPRYSLFFAGFVLLLVFSACKHTQPVSVIKQEKAKSVAPVNKESIVVKYRLIVSFFSRGAGINRELKSEFEKFLKQHDDLKYEVFRWGREGEVDYCFKLEEMTQQQQEDFVKKVSGLLNNADMIRVIENMECVHKR